MALVTQGFRPILLLAIAAVLPILAFAGVISIISWQQERDAAAQEALGRVRTLSVLIDRELAAQIEMVKALTELPGLRDDNFTDVKDTLRRVQQQQPLWLSALVVAADGTVVVDTGRPVPHRAVEIASLRDVVDKRMPSIGNIMMGRQHPGLPIRAPVFRDGRVSHVVTIVIRPDAIGDLLLRANLPAAWIGSVLDQSGLLVARTHGEGLLAKPAGEFTLASHRRGGEGLRHGRTLEGIETVSAYHVSPNTGWSVHIGIPIDIYEIRLDRRFWTTAAGAFAALLLAALFTIFLVREIRDRRTEAAALEQSRRLEALGRLTGGIAHSFNDLLTAIIGGVQILRRRIPEANETRHLDMIDRVAESGARITRELLIFARGGSSQPQPLDLNEHLRNSMGMIRQTIGQNISIRFDLAPDIMLVNVDSIQLNLALLNLATNAHDAMQGTGSLRISTGTAELDGKKYVLLTISDPGAGIAAEDLPNVFDPFFTTKEAGRGVGLGLAQVYGFARQSGGTAEIQSIVGRGTTITIRLPASDLQRSPAPLASTPASMTELKEAYGSVLVVDNNSNVCATIAEWLEELGYEVHPASNAAEALALLGQKAIEVMVTDVVLSGTMDGKGLAEEVRRRWPDTQIILMSGYGAYEAQAAGWKVIDKPFRFSLMASAVGDAMDAARRAKT